MMRLLTHALVWAALATFLGFAHAALAQEVIRGTSETYQIGPPKSNLPKPKVTTRSTRRSGLARIGGRRR